MSARAACRLATLGFQHIYDYTPGKTDWIARALPVEGEQADRPRAIDFARTDVVTCRLDDPIADVRARVQASPYGFALVTSDEGVLLGRLRRTALTDNSAVADTAMEPGPSTTRPDIAPDALRQRFQQRDLTTALLTDPDGRLLGVVLRRDMPEAGLEPPTDTVQDTPSSSK
jgi:CBS domain-containing protein